MRIVISSPLVRKASHYERLHAFVPAGWPVLRTWQILWSLSVKSLPPVLFLFSQRTRTISSAWSDEGQSHSYRSNPGGTREGGRGDEQLKKLQTCWPQREPSSVDSSALPPISSSSSSLRGVDLPQSTPPSERFMALCLLLCSFPGF